MLNLCNVLISEHTWQVQLLNRGISTMVPGYKTTSELMLTHRLCLTDKTLSLIKQEENNVIQTDFPLSLIRSCGCLKNYFYLEVCPIAVLAKCLVFNLFWLRLAGGTIERHRRRWDLDGSRGFPHCVQHSSDCLQVCTPYHTHSITLQLSSTYVAMTDDLFSARWIQAAVARNSATAPARRTKPPSLRTCRVGSRLTSADPPSLCHPTSKVIVYGLEDSILYDIKLLNKPSSKRRIKEQCRSARGAATN